MQSLLLLTEQAHIEHQTDDDDVLEWHVLGLPYSIPYRIVNHQIQILRVFHDPQQRPDSWFDH
jgi:plasmid stabilization system protein ParE